MARTCTICSHSERDDIDLAIVSGQSQRAVAAAFRVSHDAIRRHAANHVSSDLHVAAKRHDDLRADNLIGAMVTVAQEAQDALTRAKEAQNDRLALSAIREVRESVKAVAALVPAPEDEEVFALVRALGDVLPRHPEVAAELGERLRADGQRELADAIGSRRPL